MCHAGIVKNPLRLALVLIVVGALAAVAYVMWADEPLPAGSLGRFGVPEIGQTKPGELTNGQPVFVSTDLDGSVAVVATTSTHLDGDAMAWCPLSRTIDDVPHGGRFDVHGRYLAGPGRSDLGTYVIEISETGTELVVVSFVEPEGRSISPNPPIANLAKWCDDGDYELHPQYIND